MNEAKKVIIACALTAILTSVVFLGFGLCIKSLQATRAQFASLKAESDRYEELYKQSRREVAEARDEVDEYRAILGKLGDSVSRSDDAIAEIEQISKDLQDYFPSSGKWVSNNGNVAANR